MAVGLGVLLAGCGSRQAPELAAAEPTASVGPGGEVLEPLPVGGGVLPPPLYTTPVALNYPSLAAPPAVWFAREMTGFDGRPLPPAPPGSAGRGQPASVQPPAGVVPTLEGIGAQQGTQPAVVVLPGRPGVLEPIPPPLSSTADAVAPERLPAVRSTPFFSRGLDGATPPPADVTQPPRPMPAAATTGSPQPIASPAPAGVSAAPPAGFYAVPQR